MTFMSEGEVRGRGGRGGEGYSCRLISKECFWSVGWTGGDSYLEMNDIKCALMQFTYISI